MSITANPAPPGHPTEQGAWARRLVLALALWVPVTALIGHTIAPLLLREAPVALLVLHPYQPFALLVNTKLDTTTFVVVVTLASALPGLPLFLVGRWHGERALRWLGRGHNVRRGGLSERLFARSADLAVLLVSGLVVVLLAGATRMSMRRFVVLNTVNSLAWITVNRAAATAAAGPLATVVRFLDEHATAFTLTFVAATALMVVRAHRTGRSPALRARPA